MNGEKNEKNHHLQVLLETQKDEENPLKPRVPVLGIDLGTAQSSIAIVQNKKVELIPTGLDSYAMPSYVTFRDMGRVVGYESKDEYQNLSNTVFDVKRMIGKRFNDPNVLLSEQKATWPFRLRNLLLKPKIEVTSHNTTRWYAPEEISSMVLMKLRRIAEDHLHRPVKDVAISVPAHFNHSQRKATRDAGRIAGLNVVCIVNEPTAAVVTYYIKGAPAAEHNALIIDLGANKLNCSLATVCQGNIKVLRHHSDPELGGHRFDDRMVDHMRDLILKKHNVDISGERLVLRRLRLACERVKIQLTANEEASIDMPQLMPNVDFTTVLTRAAFDDLCDDMYAAVVNTAMTTLRLISEDESFVDVVILAGASTRMPGVSRAVRDVFGPDKIRQLNPEAVVAHGTAIMGAIARKDFLDTICNFGLTESLPQPISVNHNASPTMRLFEPNIVLPASTLMTCVTQYDCQTRMRFAVYEGAIRDHLNNQMVGQFVVKDLKSARKGAVQLELLFEINVQGFLSVSARNLTEGGTRCEIQVEEQYSYARSEEVERMILDAKRYNEEDVELREAHEMKIELLSYCYTNEAFLRDDPNPDVISDEDSARMLDDIGDALNWVNENPHATKVAYERQFARLKEALLGLEMPNPDAPMNLIAIAVDAPVEALADIEAPNEVISDPPSDATSDTNTDPVTASSVLSSIDPSIATSIDISMEISTDASGDMNMDATSQL